MWILFIELEDFFIADLQIGHLGKWEEKVLNDLCDYFMCIVLEVHIITVFVFIGKFEYGINGLQVHWSEPEKDLDW